MCTAQTYADRANYALSNRASGQAARPGLRRFTARPPLRFIPAPVELAPELWRPVVGYETRYEVSSKGRIRSLKKGHGIRPESGGIRPAQQVNGYFKIQLTGEARLFTGVHRLVARAFIANPLNKPEVNHRDSNPLNNTWANLEWATPSENAIHAATVGGSQKGFRNLPGRARKTVPQHVEQQVIADYFNLTTVRPSQRQLATRHRLSLRAVKRILHGHQKAARRDPQTLASIAADYANRRGIGLTIEQVADRYSLTIPALKAIARRAKAQP